VDIAGYVAARRAPARRAGRSFRSCTRATSLEVFTCAAIEFILVHKNEARGFGGRHAPTISPQQLKEVIQMAHTNVGSVASLGALVGGEVHR
jgi:hypothetical protein